MAIVQMNVRFQFEEEDLRQLVNSVEGVNYTALDFSSVLATIQSDPPMDMLDYFRTILTDGGVSAGEVDAQTMGFINLWMNYNGLMPT